MASRRLTKVMRQAFVSAVMEDVPDLNDDICTEEFQAIIYRHMPPEVQKVYDLNKNWLEKRSEVIYGDQHNIWIYYHWDNYVTDSLPQEALQYLDRLRDRRDERRAMRKKLEGITEGARTIKELKTMLPELEKYMPEDTPAPTKQLPVISNLMADVVKLGWPKGKIVNGIVTIEGGFSA